MGVCECAKQYVDWQVRQQISAIWAVFKDHEGSSWITRCNAEVWKLFLGFAFWAGWVLNSKQNVR